MHVTKLEILTIAYIMVDVSLCLIWWDKPRNIDHPFQVSQETPPPPHYTRPHLSYLERLTEMMVGFDDDSVRLSSAKQVPMFYSGRPYDDDIIFANAAALVIGGIFAGLNCIAWSYDAPSFAELVLWRISSLAVFGLLLLVGVSLLIQICLAEFLKWQDSDDFSVLRCMLLLSGFLYMVARVLSIVLAFMELRSAPSSTYDTVSWIRFIPHV